MCYVNSHDHRIQPAVRQIIQLIDVVSGSRLDVHLLFPSLIVSIYLPPFSHWYLYPHYDLWKQAGLAARYEKHRTVVRKTLSPFYGTGFWVLPGAEFIKVLDHVWHGVGAGGAPVNWEDYVCSRKAMLPVT